MVIWRFLTIFTGGSGPRAEGGGPGGAVADGGAPALLPAVATTPGRADSGVPLVSTAGVAPPGGVGDQPLSAATGGRGAGVVSPPGDSGGRPEPVEPPAPPAAIPTPLAPFLTASSARLLSFFA